MSDEDFAGGHFVEFGEDTDAVVADGGMWGFDFDDGGGISAAEFDEDNIVIDFLGEGVDGFVGEGGLALEVEGSVG